MEIRVTLFLFCVILGAGVHAMDCLAHVHLPVFVEQLSDVFYRLYMFVLCHVCMHAKKINLLHANPKPINQPASRNQSINHVFLVFPHKYELRPTTFDVQEM